MNDTLNELSGIMLVTVNTNSFAEWLNEQIQERGISQAELARRANISKASVSKALDPNSTLGWDVCYGIAQALQIPPLLVFRKAGLLQARKSDNELRDEALLLFDELEKADQEETLEFMRMKYRRAQLYVEANTLTKALDALPPDAVNEVVQLIDDYMRKHGFRRVK